MRKALALTFLILSLFQGVAQAQNRGVMHNVYASWVNVAATAVTTVTFPFESRDVFIQNGSALDLCVSPKGDTITTNTPTGGTGACRNTQGAADTVFQLDAGTDVTLYDFATSSVTFRALVSATSPVSVIATF